MILVRAERDADAGVRVAASDGIGLVTEAATFETLAEKIPAMIGDLLEGEPDQGDFRVEIVARASILSEPRVP